MTDNDQHLDDPAMSRLKTLLQHAVDNLDEVDREERARWCARHGQPGIVADFTDAEVIRFTWGDRLLATIDRAIIFDDAQFRVDFVPECPDHIPDWLGDGGPHPGIHRIRPEDQGEERTE